MLWQLIANFSSFFLLLKMFLSTNSNFSFNKNFTDYYDATAAFVIGNFWFNIFNLTLVMHKWCKMKTQNFLYFIDQIIGQNLFTLYGENDVMCNIETFLVSITLWIRFQFYKINYLRKISIEIAIMQCKYLNWSAHD